MQSSKRFNEIQHEITGISSKVLAKELKDLELNDFITRNIYPGTPVSIIYEATEYSRTLKNVLTELSVWGGQHREKVKQSMQKQSNVRVGLSWQYWNENLSTGGMNF